MAVASSFAKAVLSSASFAMYLLRQLPLAAVAGLRVAELDGEHCKVRIKYGYWTKNPFRSIYFAALCMAGEMASGMLVMSHIQGSGKSISMLATGLKAQFTKKAMGIVHFESRDGALVERMVSESVTTGEGRRFEAESVGVDELGDEVARFVVEWSVKARG